MSPGHAIRAARVRAKNEPARQGFVLQPSTHAKCGVERFSSLSIPDEYKPAQTYSAQIAHDAGGPRRSRAVTLRWPSPAKRLSVITAIDAVASLEEVGHRCSWRADDQARGRSATPRAGT